MADLCVYIPTEPAERRRFRLRREGEGGRSYQLCCQRDAAVIRRPIKRLQPADANASW